ncbi:unnamed protein product, partial [Discosporangium mesarthrocarpum]
IKKVDIAELLQSQAPDRAMLDWWRDKHGRKFARWKSELDWGYSLLFHGFGSKRELLQRFEAWFGEVEEGSAVVGYDGFSLDASVRDLLDSLCLEVLGREDLSCSNLTEYAGRFVRV